MTHETVLVTAGPQSPWCSRSAFETFALSLAFGYALEALAAAFAIFTFALAFMSSFVLVK